MTYPTEEQKRKWLDEYEKNGMLDEDTIRAILTPAPVDAEVQEADGGVRYIVDDDGDYEFLKDTRTGENIRSMQEICGLLNRAATKNMGDAVTREDIELADVIAWADGIQSALGTEYSNKVTQNEAYISDCVLRGYKAATSPKSCECNNIFGGREYLIERIKVVEKSCDGLVKAVQSFIDALRESNLGRTPETAIPAEYDTMIAALDNHRKNMGDK